MILCMFLLPKKPSAHFLSTDSRELQDIQLNQDARLLDSSLTWNEAYFQYLFCLNAHPLLSSIHNVSGEIIIDFYHFFSSEIPYFVLKEKYSWLHIEDAVSLCNILLLSLVNMVFLMWWSPTTVSEIAWIYLFALYYVRNDFCIFEYISVWSADILIHTSLVISRPDG